MYYLKTITSVYELLLGNGKMEPG